MTEKIINKSEIIRLLKTNTRTIESYGAKRIGLFGSFQRNKQTSRSDIDLLIEFQPGKKSFDNFINLVIFLEELFNSKVDLVTPESLSKSFLIRIQKEIDYVPFNT
jgi:predicted nucleotidyltransferase